MRFNRAGRGVRRKPGEMNGLETAYSQHLELLRQAGEIDWWTFEALKLRLAPATFYTPDFLVMLSNGELEVHEVKGFMRDDANVKVKVAAEIFPFRFFVVRRQVKRAGGGWEREQVGQSPRSSPRCLSARNEEDSR